MSKTASMSPTLFVAALLLALGAAAEARPWHSSEEFGSWGSYRGVGGSFGGSLSASLGGNFGLGFYNNGQNEGGTKGRGIHLFGSGSSSLLGSGYGNFGFFSGGHRYPKGYGFIPRPGAGGNPPPENAGGSQPPVTPDLGPNSKPDSVSPAPKPSIDVPFEVDTTGVAQNAPQPETPDLPGTPQTELQPERRPVPPAPIEPFFPKDSNSVESVEYPQSKENSIEFFSAETDDIGGEVTSDEILLGGVGVLNPRFGQDFSSEEKKPSFWAKLRRLFG